MNIFSKNYLYCPETGEQDQTEDDETSDGDNNYVPDQHANKKTRYYDAWNGLYLQ